MSRKIVAVLGSGRNEGNSYKALNKTITAIRSNGLDVQLIRLGELDRVEHCIGCDGCRRNKKNVCVLKDGFMEIADKLRQSDTVIIAAPVYFFGFNSLTKAFLDRIFYSSEGYDGSPNLMKDKRIALILTYGDVDEYSSGAINAINTFKDIAAFVGFKIEDIIHGTATESGPESDLLEKSGDLGLKLSR